MSVFYSHVFSQRVFFERESKEKFKYGKQLVIWTAGELENGF
jgi:hypothetical protein